MTLYRFNANIVLEATSEEDAVNQVCNRLSTIARQLGNGETLAANQPFFTLSSDARGEPVDLKHDPIFAEKGPTPQPEEVPTPDEENE